ncbi:MAG: helicase-exonuclease AddAB subunit AddA [Oscillospiraceae bacterium]|jgi:ATP-dependent helicase/nuclease subunit A|nr:helicase-exonuclease AddAB subunit AddA [Oscillospiraceae bacterium]
MSRKIWTESQKGAFEAFGQFHVISAAAGSGKTAVIVERVLKILTNDTFCEADKILIVTFTKAAAAEMKSRIRERLEFEINKNPYNEKLKRQKILFKNSFVGTIDAFCFRIVRENFEKCGILSNFRIAEENEIAIVKENAANFVIENIYESRDTELIETIDFFSNEKGDSKFIEFIFKTYNFTRSCLDVETFVENSQAIYGNDSEFEYTICGKILKEHLVENFNFAKLCLGFALRLLKQCEKPVKCLESLQNDLTALEKFNMEQSLECLIIDFKNFKFTNCKILNLDETEKKRFKFLRDYAKKTIEKLGDLAFEKDYIKKVSNEIYKILKNFFKVLNLFSEEFKHRKYEKNILEFSDLERFTLGILQDENNNKTEYAKELSQCFDEIMVDEYQDINKLQDKIFNLISRDRQNLFIVGDAKQSIYSFRQAAPEVFLNYEINSEKNELGGKKIFLETNFRSQNKIICAVNFIFANLMNPETSGIDYQKGHALSVGSFFEGVSDAGFELKIIDLSAVSDFERIEFEAKFVASLIKKIIKSGKKVFEDNKLRPVKFGDFCVLLRSTKNKILDFERALIESGLPVNAQGSANFLETVEIQTLLSILKVINTPLQDIPLVATLMSPVFGFTIDEISQIRALKRNAAFYFSLKERSNKEDFDQLSKKCSAFLEKIEKYRIFSTSSSLEDFIDHVIEDTSLMVIVSAMSEPELRVENLRKFIGLSEKYSNENHGGFSDFMSFIEKVEVSGMKVRMDCKVKDEDSVHVMSIHASKGLEFPFCIIADCSGEFKKDYEEMIVNSKLGVSFKLKNKDGTVRFSNPYRSAFELDFSKEKIAEELRLLYVAMTRAKQNLILIISTNKSAEVILENAINKNYLCKNSEDGSVFNFFIKNSSSFSDWLLLLVAKKIDAKDFQDFLKKIKDSDWNIQIVDCNFENDISNFEDRNILTKNKQKNKLLKSVDDFLCEKILKRFYFNYPYVSDLCVPLKEAASRFTNKPDWQEFIADSEPSFLNGNFSNPNFVRMAIRGFFRFLDFDSCFMIDEKVKELLSKGFISEIQSKILLNPEVKKKISYFIKSPIGKRISKSKKIFKEYKFSIFNQLKQSSQKTIIQGSIDLVFEEYDSFVIVDYKFDKTSDFNKLIDKYRAQLELYKTAFEKCEEKKVKELIIYSFKFASFVVLE